MNSAEHVTTLITNMYRLAPGSVRPDVPLHQLDIDSLALEELRLILEDELHVDLQDASLTSRSTVGELQALVHAKSAVA
ncbi:acyl carrier protein [Streptomyces sp. NPDC006552]|uniref:acyl carrier protein n=1 Tax=Streptomyces sp. NPDC006552 TaxID=3157179 RepID=UPI0033A45E33